MKNKKKLIVSVICTVGVLLMAIMLVVGNNQSESTQITEKNNINKTDILEIVQKENVSIDKFLVYGTHLNISGDIFIVEQNNVKSLSIVLTNSLKDEKEYSTSFEVKEDKIFFETSEYINKGINLEEIEVENYGIFLKIVLNDEIVKYYSFNQDNFEEIEYYTISNNNRCDHLAFKYNSEKSYIQLNVENIDMPDDVYDITIDAGHGGSDPGARYKEYNESDITLEYAKTLKEELEKQGLKVKLTREDDTRVKEYGEEGRAVIPNKVKSKYTFSIHLNSSVSSKYSGVEVYASSNLDLSFAKMLADNIVKYANTNYSQNEVSKTLDGVYVRTLSKEDIEDSEKTAKKAGYEPYKLTTDTPYLFIIRETGGKSTNAYVDGRNSNYAKNIYYNSNIGNESYLLELGFINSNKDLNNLLNNKEGYIKGIVESIIKMVK